MKDDIFEQVDDISISTEQHIEETHLPSNDDMSDKEVFDINNVSKRQSNGGILLSLTCLYIKIIR